MTSQPLPLVLAHQLDGMPGGDSRSAEGLALGRAQRAPPHTCAGKTSFPARVK